jgi:tetratricopeptide (TPR) repeat protein
MYPEEIEALKQTVTLKPDMGYAYFMLGTAYNRLDRYQEAVASFTKATKYIRNQPMIYNNMAISYGKLGNTDEEIATLKKALSLRPKYIIAHFNLGMAYLKKDRRDDAMKEYHVLMKIDEGAAASLKKEIDASRK